ncbi:MAG: PrsW family glutamic-type intramembrane protease [Bacteroidales bacterium]|nr:PrsW family glutamic-type intramembrane protease [Bacteroidales bacterium]
MLIVLSASLLPVAVLLLYIYRRDTFQKEPFRLLAKAFFFGILAAVLDTAVASLFNYLVPQPPVSPLNDALYTSLVLAALPEELCKLVMLYLCIWKSPFFDEYFDGVEYCAFLGLGFAAIENVLYVLQGGLGLAVSRGLSPCRRTSSSPYSWATSSRWPASGTTSARNTSFSPTSSRSSCTPYTTSY